jgi:hypothetical protein
MPHDQPAATREASRKTLREHLRGSLSSVRCSWRILKFALRNAVALIRACSARAFVVSCKCQVFSG